MEVEAKRESISEGRAVEASGKSSIGGTSASVGGSATAAPFTFTFSPSSSPSGDGSSDNTTRRRPAAPSTIPNFPSPPEARNPPAQTAFSPSPSRSSTAHSPSRSPPTPLLVRRPFFPIALPQPVISPPTASGASTWLALAASSGAPTQSIEGRPSTERSSPQLGYPFERLNIGGSWSGANLWGEDAQGGCNSDGGQVSSDGNPKTHPFGGMSAGTLAKYRAMMGKYPHREEEMETERKEPSPWSSKIPAVAPLAQRRASLPKNSLAAFSPPHAKSPSPLASSSGGPALSPGSVKLRPLSATALLSLVQNSSTLILDLRPPSSFHASHLPSSHSLPVPSTLLRRPAFTLQKLTQMLPPTSSEEVAKWREKKDVVLIDNDSKTAPEGSLIDGLAGKFEREGFGGHLWFIKGGHKAVQAIGVIKVSSEDGEDQELQATPNAAMGPSGLIAGRLGKMAFLQGAITRPSTPAFADVSPESTGSGRKGKPSHPGMKLNLAATPGVTLRADPFASPPSMAPSMTHFTIEHSMGVDGPGSPQVKLQPANPFFDNIRQNLELSHGGITERIHLALAPDVLNRAAELPPWLGDLVKLPEAECSTRLADQFYRAELAEQKRLQGVMDFHSKGSAWAESFNQADGQPWFEERTQDAAELKRCADAGLAMNDNYFPFSITAGVERGGKNRYKNIWPYDFSRVRLSSPTDDESDYINASFVQPRGTARRYIATQGPLDATYRDFWTLVWEQDVRVIVMLTKQFEGGLIKCGNYWEDQQYGHLRLQVLSQTGGEDKLQHATTGFDFGVAAMPAHSADPDKAENIKRVFLLSRDNDPGPPRKVVQIQCTAWPDFDVPDTPETLLSLIKDVDSSYEELRGVDATDRGYQSPVLVHCSAGVGRTGSYIIADAIIDGMRRERRSHHSHLASPSPGRSLLSSQSRLGRPSPSNGGKPSGSVESAKSVSFLSPFPSSRQTESTTTIFSTSPSAISTSPMTLDAPLNGANIATSYLDAEANQAGAIEVAKKEDSMEHDSSAELHEISHHGFMKHRGSRAASVDSEEGWTRRPSLTSAFNSLERLNSDALHEDLNLTHQRTPSPISEMENPIASVLEGMRVQRMSLVQSLRQYLFVHRVIIQSYLSMIDDDRDRRRETSETVESERGSGSRSRTSTTSLSLAPSTPSSVQGTEDEGHAKRRASPIEPDAEDGYPRPSATVLTKRLSVKRIRAEVEQTSSPVGAGSGVLLGSETKNMQGRMRSRSKLGLGEIEGPGL